LKASKALCLALTMGIASCASQAVKPYEGKTFSDVRIDWGAPVNDFRTADGRRVVQYYWGGGTVVMPSTTTATATTVGNSTFVSGQTMPGAVISSPGCLISFIMKQEGRDWRVVEARYPQRLSC
jgi:hypothetical protein